MVTFVCSFLHMRPQIACHIGCICFTFLQCAFSNVSSNGLPEIIHGYIGCACLIFLHCGFTNVSPNCLFERIHCHIACNCLTYLHSEFLSVNSKRLLNRMQSRIGYICLLVPTHETSNCLSPWLHLFHFSPLCVFRCLLIWPSSDDY